MSDRESTAAHPRWAGASLWAILLVGACSAGPDTESDDPASARTGPTATTKSPTTPDASPPATGTSNPAPCRSKEARAVAELEWPILQQVWRVMASPPEGSAQAAQGIRSSVDSVAAPVVAQCGAESSATGTFVRSVRTITGSNLDDAGVRRVLAAFSAWAAAVGAPDNLKETAASLTYCDRLEDDVSAGYAVWSEPAPYGKRSWVQLIVENNTSTRYTAQLGGELWATGLRPDLAGGDRDPRRDGHRWVWGGSSADFMYIEPGVRSTTFVGVGEGYHLYMKPHGEIYDVRPDLSVQADGHICPLPMPRIN